MNASIPLLCGVGGWVAGPEPECRHCHRSSFNARVLFETWDPASIWPVYALVPLVWTHHALDGCTPIYALISPLLYHSEHTAALHDIKPFS